jgi:hypothetical protein
MAAPCLPNAVRAFLGNEAIDRCDFAAWAAFQTLPRALAVVSP